MPRLTEFSFAAFKSSEQNPTFKKSASSKRRNWSLEAIHRRTARSAVEKWANNPS